MSNNSVLIFRLQDWLDEHPTFVQNYFLRKVSRSLVDQWLIAHSTSTGTLGKSACVSSKHLIFLEHHPLTACKTRRHRHSIAYSQVPSESPSISTHIKYTHNYRLNRGREQPSLLTLSRDSSTASHSVDAQWLCFNSICRVVIQLLAVWTVGQLRSSQPTTIPLLLLFLYNFQLGRQRLQSDKVCQF